MHFEARGPCGKARVDSWLLLATAPLFPACWPHPQTAQGMNGFSLKGFAGRFCKNQNTRLHTHAGHALATAAVNVSARVSARVRGQKETETQHARRPAVSVGRLENGHISSVRGWLVVSGNRQEPGVPPQRLFVLRGLTSSESHGLRPKPLELPFLTPNSGTTQAMDWLEYFRVQLWLKKGGGPRCAAARQPLVQLFSAAGRLSRNTSFGPSSALRA